MTIRQSGFLKDVTGTYILKDPEANLQYGVDWKDWLETSDQVSTSTWRLETTGTSVDLLVEGVAVLDNVSLASISAGTIGEIYTVANIIETQQGYKDTRRFRVKVEKRFIP
jgi:hypothetical protein